MRCELQGVVHTASRVVKRDDELGTEGRAPLDVGVLVDVAGDAEVDQVQLAGLGIVDSTVQVHRAGYNNTVQVYRIGYNSAVQVHRAGYKRTVQVYRAGYNSTLQYRCTELVISHLGGVGEREPPGQGHLHLQVRGLRRRVHSQHRGPAALTTSADYFSEVQCSTGVQVYRMTSVQVYRCTASTKARQPFPSKLSTFVYILLIDVLAIPIRM